MASTACSRSGASDKRLRKNFDRFMPRNPLISLDSDEEIQGNPTLIIGGFRNETARSQENPNRIVSTTSRKPPRRRHTAQSNTKPPSIAPSSGVRSRRASPSGVGARGRKAQPSRRLGRSRQ